MQRRTRSWQSIDKENIGREIQRLFSLQDKPLLEDKKNLLLDELEQCDIPSGAVIAGIRSLVDDDLRSIKFITLKTAAHKFITRGYDDYQCVNCGGEGVVFMRTDGPSYEHNTCVACICTRGQALADANGVLRWNGEKEQMNGEHKLIKSAKG